MIDDKLLSTDELCEYLGVTRTWVWDKVQAREIPAIRLSQRLLRFRRSDIDDYLATKSVAPAR